LGPEIVLCGWLGFARSSPISSRSVSSNLDLTLFAPGALRARVEHRNLTSSTSAYRRTCCSCECIGRHTVGHPNEQSRRAHFTCRSRAAWPQPTDLLPYSTSRFRANIGILPSPDRPYTSAQSDRDQIHARYHAQRSPEPHLSSRTSTCPFWALSPINEHIGRRARSWRSARYVTANGTLEHERQHVQACACSPPR